MKKFQEIYDENKKLDAIFIAKYDHDDLVRKNKLELLVEIGELANETKCFKYWTKKEPNKELVEEEYADCLIMTLCFFSLLHIELDEEYNYLFNELDTIDIFAKLYSLASDFYYSESRDTIKKIFVILVNLGYQLGFNDEKIINITLKKIITDKERLKNS